MGRRGKDGNRRRRAFRRAGFAGFLALSLLVGPPLAVAETAAAQGPGDEGPFEERNQFPFHLLFLAFPARGASILPAGETEFRISQTYSSIFVGSDIFFSGTGPTGPDRRRLSRALVNAAQAADPGQSLFFVDSESGRTELRFRAGVGGRFEAGLEVPFLTYRGGFLDAIIESYHDRFGFANGGRDEYERNRTRMALILGGDSYFRDRPPAAYRPGDVSLFGRFALASTPHGALALTLAVKAPTGNPEALAGSGSLDAGAEVEATSRWGRHRLHLAAGWVRTGDWSLFPRFDPADVASTLAAYEFAGSRGIAWIGQIQSQTSVFRNRTDNDLAQPSTELLGGVRWRRRSAWSYEAAFIENLFNQNNGVDIGFRMGASVRVGTR